MENIETEKYIKLCLIKKGMTFADVAKKTNQTPQALSNKMVRKVFKQNDLEEIAAALDCHLDIRFIDNKTNEPLI